MAKAVKKAPSTEKDSDGQSLDDRLEEAIRKARAQAKDRKAKRPAPPPVEMPSSDTGTRRTTTPPGATPPRTPAPQPAARQPAPPQAQPRKVASPPLAREVQTTRRTATRDPARAPSATRTAQDALAEMRAHEARLQAQKIEYDELVHRGHEHKRRVGAGKRGTGAAMARRNRSGSPGTGGKSKRRRRLTYPEMMIAEAVMGEPRCRKPHRPHGMPAPNP